MGGGWSGCAAALAARQAGADEVVLLERTDSLLGTGLVGGTEDDGNSSQQRPDTQSDL